MVYDWKGKMDRVAAPEWVVAPYFHATNQVLSSQTESKRGNTSLGKVEKDDFFPLTLH